jgi:hypothetical protein
MIRATRWALWRILAATTLACAGGEESPGKDTAPPPPSPADGPAAPAVRPWNWDRNAGAYFVIRSGAGESGRLVDPAFGYDQLLDSLVALRPGADADSFDLIGGVLLPGTVRIEDVHLDSSCVGWPTGRLSPRPAPTWRVAFPAGQLAGIAFDSLPALPARDSAAVTADAARAASRLPDDTSQAFRGRPFIVRQANRFPLPDSVTAGLIEIVRLVPQEANPLQEQIVMILERRAGGDRWEPAFHVRSIGLEETLSSLDLLAVLQVRSTGRVALLVRRDREGGFVLQWIERVAPGRWRITWQSALDSC